MLYLVYAIKAIPKDRYSEDYHQTTLWSALNWIVDRVKLQIEIDPKYADDITFIRSEEAKINLWKELYLVCSEMKDSTSTRVRRKVRYQQIQRQKIEILQVSWLTNWH